MQKGSTKRVTRRSLICMFADVKEELWDMSKQLTDFGKNLSEMNVSLEVPDIPALNIKGGSYDYTVSVLEFS